MGRLRGRLLPRKDLAARRIIQVFDEYNYPQEVSKPFLLEDCGVHPVSGDKHSVLAEGYRDSKIYIVYTKTEIPAIVEGGGEKYEIEVRKGVWCLVIESDPHDYGVQNHYKLVVAEKNER